MNKLSIAAALGLALGLAQTPAHAAGPAWDGVEPAELILFYPGIATFEWVLGDIRVDREAHPGARVFRMGDRCIECHLEDPEELLDIGETIASGERMEPEPIDGKAGAILVEARAAFNDDTLFLKLSWQQPEGSGAAKMDEANPVKVAFMLDAGKVERADQAGCWASCHTGVRSMPEGDEGKTKYVANGSVADGVFYDLVQWRSGEDKFYDGHVADSRVMEGGTAVQSVTGSRDGDTWTVVFERKLSGGAGNITLEPGGVYNIGVAIHDDHTAGRFHHVSMGYRLGLDAEGEIVAQRF